MSYEILPRLSNRTILRLAALNCQAINNVRNYASLRTLASSLQCRCRVGIRNKFPISSPSLLCVKLDGSSNKTQEFVFNQTKRTFWGVDVAFNRVNEERVRLAGPDRAAAEWVLRNGGAIKWTSSSNHLKDYNMLPTTQFDEYKLEELDLSKTTVLGMGFEHLKDLKYVRKISMNDCKSLGDDGLGHFFHVSDTLEVVEISYCPMITAKGLQLLLSLKNLKLLVLFDLMEIKDLESVAANLRLQMPAVDIKVEDPTHNKLEAKQ